MHASVDVTVLGGGPAGATASLLLASWGHLVRVITRPAGGKRLAVSLPPSCSRLFDAIGIRAAIDRAAFIRSTGNTVWWGSANPRIETFVEGARGWQVELDAFSAVLLEAARAAGARVERRMIGADESSGFVIDGTGRSGVVARSRDLRRYYDGPRTIALIGEWRRTDRWPVPDDTHTLIESYGDGWMWSVPVPGGARHIAAMIDPRRSDLDRGGSSTDVYLTQIQRTRVFRKLIADASLQGDAWGWDASQYYAASYAGDGWLLAGDAGSFIDPLSSAGVKKALASGWLAAVVAHTCLKSPSMRAHALEFFDAREREIAAQLTRQSRQFLADAAADHPHAFWADRTDGDDSTSSDEIAVQRAFERLKRSDEWRPRVGDAVAIEPRPCIRGHEIVLEPHIVTGDGSVGVRYVRAVDVVALVRMAPATGQVPDLFDEYVKRIGPVPLPDFLFAVATAVARGWLVAE